MPTLALEKIIRALEKSGVRYLLVGGLHLLELEAIRDIQKLKKKPQRP